MPSHIRTEISATAGVLGLVLVTAACSTNTNKSSRPRGRRRAGWTDGCCGSSSC
jgi:hypothetical protein